MAWGPESDICTVFGDVRSVDEISFDPDWQASGQLHIKQFLQNAIGKAFARTRPLIARQREHGVYLIADRMAEEVGLFEPLHRQIGSYTGTIPGLRIPATECRTAVEKVDFAEAVWISLSYCDNRLWLLMKPDVWIWPAFVRRNATDWLAQRKSDRRNAKYDALISAWAYVLSDGVGAMENFEISPYEGQVDSSNPSFTLSNRTGYAKMRGW